MKSRWSIHRRLWTDQVSVDSDRTGRNPARGFYRVYTYDLTEKEAEEDWVWSLQKEERLALVLLDIGKCADRALSETELAKAERIFSFFRAHHRQMIVRVVYDRNGHGMEREPRSISKVCGHMRQLGPLFARFSTDILTVQGLFIGSWGEMHDSRYLEKEQLTRLYQTLREAAGEAVCISVRKPQYQRMLEAEDGTVCTGLYDDAILGSDTDMGTFGWIDDCTDRQIMWTPCHELEFIDKQAACTPVGGEVLSGALTLTWEEVLTRMRLMQLTYLNRVHEPAVWETWSVARCDSLQGDGWTRAEYLRAYLGYRYVLVDVAMSEDPAEGDQICVTLRNTGFACCYDCLRMELGVGKKRLQASFDGKELAAGGETCIVFPLKQVLRGQEIDGAVGLTLALYHEKTGLPIYFANEFLDERRWDRYRSSSSSAGGIVVGVLSMEKEATS